MKIRQFILTLLFPFACMVILCACNNQHELKQIVPSTTSVWKPTWAKGFEIQELSDSSINIVLFNLESKTDTLKIIHWKRRKVERIACLSTTHIALLDKLGRLDVLKGVGFADMALNQHARQKIDAGEIKNLTTGDDTDAEIVLSLQPQLFLTYPYGGMNTDRYESNNIVCLPVSEYLEEHPLGRAEWIILVGYLLGEEMQAKTVFAEIESDYVKLRETAMQAANKPTVFTGSYDSGSWFAPPGNSFAAHFIEDAGASYVFSDSSSSGNIVVPVEEFILKVYRADFWGKIVFEKNGFEYKSLFEDDPRISKIKANQSGRIFYCNAAESDYFGDAIAEPEVLLADLIAIFHPELIPNHQPVYFKPFFF
ncbi:MAG: ABC transporter substrate-binding protein [Flavobacteriales bacterium]